MDSAFISTILGAVLALSGGVLADRLRGRGERARDDRAVRRQAYREFLSAVDGAYGSLRVLADPAADRPDPRQVSTVLADEGIYSVRQDLLVIGSPPVVRAGERLISSLNQFSDTVRIGADRDSWAYHNAFHDLCDHQWLLRLAIRKDLGVEDLAHTDLDELGWVKREVCDVCRSRAEAAAPA